MGVIQWMIQGTTIGATMRDIRNLLDYDSCRVFTKSGEIYQEGPDVHYGCCIWQRLTQSSALRFSHTA